MKIDQDKIEVLKKHNPKTIDVENFKNMLEFILTMKEMHPYLFNKKESN